ncbi:MAG: hypothetical protein HY331_13505 [Chloroflexi bacterium]|nr:hypothetical protein [Chloroflexota bacterium]
MTTTREPSRSTARTLAGIELSGVLFALLGIGFGLVLLGAGETIYAVQGSVTEAATLLPVGYAFAAGMVATVNPCGILLLPSLVAYSIGRGESGPTPWPARLGKGATLGVMATLGFTVIFTIVGLIFGAGGRALGAWFPVGGLFVGGGLVLLGAWLALTGRPLGILAASRAMEHVPESQDLRSFFIFGIAYAVTSLGCTLPIFLVVASLALAARDVLVALSQFVSYALGMGVVLTVVIIAATFFQGAVNRWVRRLVPYVHRVAAAFLIGAGIYLVDYWLKAAGILGSF